MKNRRLLIVLICIGAMMALGVIFSGYLLGPEAPAATSTIYVAAQELIPGKRVENADLKAVTVPVDNVPAGALVEASSIVNRVVKGKVNPGDALTDSMLYPSALAESMTSDIPVGFRAFSIAVNEASSVGGFVSPGSYVDISLSGKDAYNQPFSKLIVQHAKVLAIAQMRNQSQLARSLDGTPMPTLGTSVTLLITPTEVQALDVARTLGTLTLALRGIADQNVSPIAPSANRSSLDFPGQDSVEVIRGVITEGGTNLGQRMQGF